ENTMAKVHYRRSGNRTHCRYSSRPSRVKLKMVDLPEFLDVVADLQCTDCLRTAQRDVLLAKIGKGANQPCEQAAEAASTQS
ncbi:TPA: hypothetical protein ACKPYP_006678, partial [Pseudomonas aeruginosa]